MEYNAIIHHNDPAYADASIKKHFMAEEDDYTELTKDIKAKLLQIPVLDVIIDGKRSPLMIAAGITTASVYKCMKGDIRQISYPTRE